MASPAIELRNVALTYDRADALPYVYRDLSFSIPAGEALVVIGPSGGGKSSLLKLIAGLIEPTRGKVLINGQDWRAMRAVERAKTARRMGMLFQKNALFDSLSVAENVSFPLREVMGVSEQEAHETVAYYLDAVGLTAAANLYPDEISGGMQKRLGIARALALKPEIVLYDDPTAGLDPITSRKIVKLIADLQKEMNTTVVAVTNDMKRAEQLAHRIGMAVEGEFILCGSPAETLASDEPRVRQFVRGQLEGPLTVIA